MADMCVVMLETWIDALCFLLITGLTILIKSELNIGKKFKAWAFFVDSIRRFIS